MSKAWQFWPGIGRNHVNPSADYFSRVAEHNRQEEIRLAAREEELRLTGETLGSKYRLKFLDVQRRHPSGTRIPKNARLAWTVPAKSVFFFCFEVAPAGSVGWRVRQGLAEGVTLSGSHSKGWTVWVEEKDTETLATLFKKGVNSEKSENVAGTLTNFGGHYRIMGATNNSQYWVVSADGSLREPDEDIGRGYAQKYKGSEGDKRWDIVAAHELAISWSKSFTAAAHVFTINKLPGGGLTSEQVSTVERLELEISSRFEGVSGCSGRLSPSIEDGWGLSLSAAVEDEKVSEGLSKPASSFQLNALLDKFKK